MMNQKNDTTPDFAIEFRADEMEPLADVVPEGDVTFQLINSTDIPQDFALVVVTQDEVAWRDATEPVQEDDIEVVGLIEGIPAHGARDLDVV
ncbi:MAG: hypothetical protein M0R75_14640, partial [Dehalococcoidia bacterium]|nr:hypothetical protein [Dehalococcoidia bacterium]